MPPLWVGLPKKRSLELDETLLLFVIGTILLWLALSLFSVITDDVIQQKLGVNIEDTDLPVSRP